MSGVVVLIAAALCGVVVLVVALPLALSGPFPTPRQGDWIIQSSIGQTTDAHASAPLEQAVVAQTTTVREQPAPTRSLAPLDTAADAAAKATEAKYELASVAPPRPAPVKTRPATERMPFAARWKQTGIPASDDADDTTTGTVRLALADESTPIAAPRPAQPAMPAQAARIAPAERKSDPAPKKANVNPMDVVDEYLWQVYERDPVKKDSSGDFTWKDPAAAKRMHMSLKDYVIRGMEPDFREQLYHAGHAMDAVGLHWSMLSAFRDDYRQELASGFKARPGNSLHGGSRAVGGYGHGRAVDLNNVDGDDETVWHWVDAHGAKYGLRRPMPGYDPAHIQAGGDWHQIAQSLRADRTRVAEKAKRPDTAAVKTKSSKAAM
jgi:hypothetical protein